jgi:hypothetical protein
MPGLHYLLRRFGRRGASTEAEIFSDGHSFQSETQRRSGEKSTNGTNPHE